MKTIERWIVDARHLSFQYDEGLPHVFKKLDWRLPQGSRTVLVGANGVGKSTLLSLIAGRHMIRAGELEVLGGSSFHDAALTSEIALVDGDFPIVLDLSVRELLEHRAPQVDLEKEKELLEILQVDPTWRMHRVSDGQRRRVQLLMALRKSVRLVLLDEVTTHLDLLVRGRFLEWLKSENENRGVTILYTTHIFDGLWRTLSHPWPTHLAFLGFQGMKRMSEISAIPELGQAVSGQDPAPLLSVCEAWMRADQPDYSG